MKATGRFLKLLKPEGSYEAEQLYSADELNQILSEFNYHTKLQKGHEIFEDFLKNNPFHLDDLRNCFLNLHKVFNFYLKEDGVGIIKALDFRRGSIKIEENIALPCDIMEGVIKELLKKTHSRATTVKHLKCRKDGAKFCEYQITWMISNVR